jgi:hypothetical protein
MQIIGNFGFWKIGLFKKYHRTICLFKLQNGWIFQNGADHYNFRSWTITLVFFNRFENQNMFWKHNFISYLFPLVRWFSFSKWQKYPRWRFSIFLWFSSSSGVLNCILLKLLFQNMIYFIFISKSWKQNFNKNKMAN